MVFWIGAKMRNRKQEVADNRYHAGCWRTRHGFYFAVSIRRTPYGACRGTDQTEPDVQLVRLA